MSGTVRLLYELALARLEPKQRSIRLPVATGKRLDELSRQYDIPMSLLVALLVTMGLAGLDAELARMSERLKT